MQKDITEGNSKPGGILIEKIAILFDVEKN